MLKVTFSKKQYSEVRTPFKLYRYILYANLMSRQSVHHPSRCTQRRHKFDGQHNHM